MIQYQVNGLIQIKLAAQPLCLISSFFFLLFELQLNNFHFAGSVISSSSCLFFSFSSVTYMKKGSKRVAGRRVRACLQLSDLANPLFQKCIKKLQKAPRDERKSDQSDNLFSWLISCFDFNEWKSNTQVPPWQKPLVGGMNYSRNQEESRIWWYQGHN